MRGCNVWAAFPVVCVLLLDSTDRCQVPRRILIANNSQQQAGDVRKTARKTVVQDRVRLVGRERRQDGQEKCLTLQGRVCLALPIHRYAVNTGGSGAPQVYTGHFAKTTNARRNSRLVITQAVSLDQSVDVGVEATITVPSLD